MQPSPAAWAFPQPMGPHSSSNMVRNLLDYGAHFIRMFVNPSCTPPLAASRLGRCSQEGHCRQSGFELVWVTVDGPPCLNNEVAVLLQKNVPLH